MVHILLNASRNQARRSSKQNCLASCNSPEFQSWAKFDRHSLVWYLRQRRRKRVYLYTCAVTTTTTLESFVCSKQGLVRQIIFARISIRFADLYLSMSKECQGTDRYAVFPPSELKLLCVSCSLIHGLSKRKNGSSIYLLCLVLFFW